VLTKEEAENYEGNYKIVFIGCFIEKFTKYENIIIDDILKLYYLDNKQYKIEWTKEMLASFIGAWFAQTKIRKMQNNLSSFFTSRQDSWIKDIME
jgi:hypothetical protein